MAIKDNYKNGECPCGKPIHDDIIDGSKCENCGHVFYQELNKIIMIKIIADGKSAMVGYSTTSSIGDIKKKIKEEWNKFIKTKKVDKEFDKEFDKLLIEKHGFIPVITTGKQTVSTSIAITV